MSEQYKFFTEHDLETRELESCGIVHGQHGNVLEIESIDFVTMLCLAQTGRTPSTERKDIVPEQFYEVHKNTLDNPHFYYTFDGVVAEFARYMKSKER